MVHIFGDQPSIGSIHQKKKGAMEDNVASPTLELEILSAAIESLSYQTYFNEEFSTEDWSSFKCIYVLLNNSVARHGSYF